MPEGVPVFFIAAIFFHIRNLPDSYKINRHDRTNVHAEYRHLVFMLSQNMTN